MLLLQMQVKSDEKKAKMPARPTRRQSAAAAAAAGITTTDELGELERRVDIVASFLALNHDARTTSRLCSGWDFLAKLLLLLFVAALR